MDIIGPNANKQKSRAAQYPFMEHFLAFWINVAEFACVPITDDIIHSQAKIVQQQLNNAGVDEDYENLKYYLVGFEILRVATLFPV